MTSQFWYDVRYSARQLIKAPLTTLIAVLSLALGIGANTAIFSLVNALMLRSLPVHDPQQLVDIHTALPDRPAIGYSADPIPFRAFEEIRKRSMELSGVFAFADQALRNVQVDGLQYPGGVIEVSGDYFSTLGVQSLLGRVLTPEDTAPGAPESVAVLDYRCWRNHFQSDPAVVGKVIRIDNVPLTIVGVTPASFRHLDIDVTVDAAVPIGFGRRDISKNWYHVLGRLKRGVTVEQARAQLVTIWPSIQQSIVPVEYKAAQRKRFLSRRLYVENARNGYSYLREQLSRPALVLMCLVAAVLLIACANLAGLLLARAAARRNEVGIRIALGAGSWPLMRLFLIESAMLAFAGAALGFGCCFWVAGFLVNMVWMGTVAAGINTAPDLRVLAFTGGIAILTGFLFGIVPALRATRVDPASALQQNSRTARGSGMALRRILIAGQVALSLVLVFGAMLFIRTLDNLRTADTGYQRDGLLCMELFPQPGREKIPNRAAYYRALVDKLSQIPGVESATYSLVLPAELPASGLEFREAVSVLPSEATVVQASVGTVGPGFFQSMGMHVRSGREFTWRDDEEGPRVTVISDSLARRLFPHQDPLGQRIKVANRPEGKDLQIVGVVNSASLWRIQSREPPAVYTAFLQTTMNQPMVDIRTATEPIALARPAEHAIETLGHHYSVRTQSLRQRLDMFLSNERIVATFSAFFGTLALILAAIGLYGLIAEAVTNRFAEIGIRMALGAQRGAILTLFVREAAILLCVGLAIGIPVALAASRLVSAMLFGVSPASVTSIVVPSVILILAGLVASYVPARRASKLEPMTALRTE